MNAISHIGRIRHIKKLEIIAILIVFFAGVLAIVITRYFSQNPAEEKIYGTLILNTDKNEYAIGDEVFIQIVSLSPGSSAICNSNLELSLFPLHIPYTIYNILPSSSCSPGSVTNSADYYAYFKPTTAGEYKITLKNNDDGNTLEKTFYVSQNPPVFSVSRWSATRIVESGSRYPMVITISASVDYKGKVTDSIPAGFQFMWVGNGTVNGNSITWDVDINANEKLELKYEYLPAATDEKVKTFGPVKADAFPELKENLWKVGVENN